MNLDVKNVFKTYVSVTAIAGVSLSVASGAKVALIGPIGSGKSSLIRVLMGLVSYRGEVRLDGLAPFRHRVELARRMAYVPQVAPQMRAPVREVAGRPVRGLSGGMRQKLLIALALAPRTDLLILDEPTASLDARNRARFFRRLGAQAAGATVLLCSHRLEEIEHLVDHVVELQAGRVVFDGPVATLLGAQSLSVLEVQPVNGFHADWLSQHGFHRGARGVWVKTVRRAEKMDLLGQLAGQLDGMISNIVARDLETIDEA